jgi:hypothetical protein
MVEAAAAEPDTHAVLEHWAGQKVAGPRRFLEELFGPPPQPSGD